ncbi:hypothetical protein Ddye_017600 [Dipteronia dyeriana]|uniref:Uncharacterized protein n=1 Tax=Dipteronia dyeriana TaxID=168575 RepID=A0AAD9U8X6_9ROSI|nr:hypothetical protein Ddye_017600 [Dipteronia dyeriana]
MRISVVGQQIEKNQKQKMSVCPITSLPQKSETLEIEEIEEIEEVAIWDCGSPLYDSYELVSLSHVIERHLLTLPTLGGSKTYLATNFYYPYDDPSNVGSAGLSSSSSSSSSSPSSIVATLSGFLAKKLWKKRAFGQRKDKRKNSKIGVCGFSARLGFSKK